MDVSVEHVYRHIRCRDSAEEVVREEERKLLGMSRKILRCLVVVDKPHLHRTKGNHFHVLVVVSIPGHEVCVSHGPEARKGDENLTAAIHHAFHAARIQTRRYLSRLRDTPHTAMRAAFGNGKSISPPVAEEMAVPSDV